MEEEGKKKERRERKGGRERSLLGYECAQCRDSKRKKREKEGGEGVRRVSIFRRWVIFITLERYQRKKKGGAAQRGRWIT